jgi:hypothetical protein
MINGRVHASNNDSLSLLLYCSLCGCRYREQLMEEVENSLTAANRDRFTTNATAFRRECSQMTLMAFNPEDTTAMFS